MRGYWENKSCSCCVPNASLPQREWRRYLKHVAGRGPTASWSFESEIQPPWQKAGLAGAMPDACALRSCCQVLCPGSEHVRGKRLLFHRAAACGLNERVLCSAPSLADLPCPRERLVTSPASPLRGELCWEVTFLLAPPLSALLPMSCWKDGENASHAPTASSSPGLLGFESLQGDVWPSPTLRTKQRVLVVHNAAAHAGRWVWVKNQCSNQGEQTKPANLHLYRETGSAPPLLTLPSAPAFPRLFSF